MASWIVAEFEDIDFGDDRINCRFQKVADAFLEKPSATISESSGCWAEAKATYRMFDNKKVTKLKILSEHQTKVSERIRSHAGIILAIQDTTYIDYTHHYKTNGLGPISCKHIHAKQKGIVCHNTLAISPEGRVFGLINQKLYCRDEETKIGRGPKGTKKRKRIPIEQKESYRWLESVQKVSNLVASSQVVHICDREGDIFELFYEISLTAHQFIVRAFGDRVVGKRIVGRRSINNKNITLWKFMESTPVKAILVVDVPKKEKQIERQAQCELKYSELYITPPYYSPESKSREMLPLKLFAIWVKEMNPPPNCEPMEWMLITNIEIKATNEALEKIEWYKKRWHIENYHKVLKSGCNIEKSRFNHSEKLEKLITLMSIIAARVYELKLIGRSDPKKLCTAILSTEEWKILYQITMKTSSLPDIPPTCREVTHWIAKLGGFMGRKNDGEPGSIVIWRGWQRLTSIIEDWKTFQLIATSG